MDRRDESAAAEQKETSRRSLWLILLAALLFGGLLAFLVIRLLTGMSLFGPPPFKAVDLQAPAPMADFTLMGTDGQSVSLSDFQGDVVALYYGYTFCPDVCPATMADLANALDQLEPSEQEQIQVIMITVDPERDLPPLLAEYVTHFDPSFIGLTGTLSEINEAAAAVGIYFQKNVSDSASDYLVDHTATVAVLDRDTHLRLLFPFGTTSADMASDLRRLVRE